MNITTNGPTARHSRTKIVATLGPASDTREVLLDLINAGADVFRLNMAHGTRDEQAGRVDRIRALSSELRVPLGILVDLAGPKIRLGELVEDPLQLAVGEKVRFVKGTRADKPRHLTSTYPKLVDELTVGNRVMLADAAVGLVVESRADGYAECLVTQDGQLRSRQGINLPGVKLSVPALSEADRDAATWAAGVGADFVGLSFVRRPEDVRELTLLLRGHGSRAKVIAKIEKPEALDCLDEIVAAADGLMVARGDLGVEIDVAEVPLAQKRIIAAGNRLQRPVIVATQMLESMQHSPQPTRAEVTDVANAVLDGCDACMLSGETAVGCYPREAVAMMNRVALAAEERFRDLPSPPEPDAPPEGVHPITQAIVLGADRIARRLGAKLLVVITKSGASALAMSKRRSYSPILGLSGIEESLRQMGLFWGVTPLYDAPVEDVAGLKAFVHDWGTRNGILSPGDTVVLLTGTGLATGMHNLVVVHRV